MPHSVNSHMRFGISAGAGLRLFTFNPGSEQEFPFYLSAVPAGFPSPAEDYVEGTLDLNEYLVRHPAATFFVRVVGDSMRDAGIESGDLLVVDRALNPVSGRIVVAAVGGELTVKRLVEQGGSLLLMPANPAYTPLDVTEDDSFAAWGVVTAVVRTL
ncbi:LexA family protein [Oceanidesulfovibrio marinus]|uniref:Translesion error-prone DNA polymerase V autoproteolytic subunit n=1 Tax=Oceanidesulfovibrio marinus TaxID=370038 RepID=A0ABX6NHY9_9BACT|nr:translesion error-prone DNA polymerase V autoproteolytic subunit [Oceanidesulfovibrio marinus]QJT10246.1 translesion error-prone DNA polymerase V autoproteolytic subunit [Oceanidesulfovibrio marinus]